MCECANVQMCKWSHLLAAFKLMCKCVVNVQMCKWSHLLAAFFLQYA